MGPSAQATCRARRRTWVRARTKEMIEPIHVVEPTLVDEAGHCHSFLRPVCVAGPDQRFEVWAGRRVRPLYQDLPQVTLRPYFTRRLRRFQAAWLYARLLRRPGRIFVPTAGANDLTLLGLAARGRRVEPGRVVMFFHWIRPTRSKLVRMGLAARRQPDLLVLAPTPEITRILRDVGFPKVREVPYPVSVRARPPSGPPSFKHLLFAGAARLDKGFDKVVDLVALLKERGDDIRVAVQTSGKHYGKRDDAIARDIDRLEALAYPGLESYPQTLDTASYLDRFHGAICLQPYDRREFAGRVSAVTIDALASGAPIITTAGTWMGLIVDRMEAGVVIEERTPAALLEAARQVIDDYGRYSENARRAADLIQNEHSGAHLLRAILQADP